MPSIPLLRHTDRRNLQTNPCRQHNLRMQYLPYTPQLKAGLLSKHFDRNPLLPKDAHPKPQTSPLERLLRNNQHPGKHKRHLQTKHPHSLRGAKKPGPGNRKKGQPPKHRNLLKLNKRPNNSLRTRQQPPPPSNADSSPRKQKRNTRRDDAGRKKILQKSLKMRMRSPPDRLPRTQPFRKRHSILLPGDNAGCLAKEKNKHKPLRRNSPDRPQPEAIIKTTMTARTNTSVINIPEVIIPGTK